MGGEMVRPWNRFFPMRGSTSCSADDMEVAGVNEKESSV
jgi:hypothetical protein